MASTEAEPAARLKEEGNQLYRQQEYEQALQKYGEALQVGGGNPIIFSNRSACYFKLKQYLHAQSEAHKAIKLDPCYAKAHARLGAAYNALEQFTLSSRSYRRAMDCLPDPDLRTPAESQLHKEWDTSWGDIMYRRALLDMRLEQFTTHIDSIMGNYGEYSWVSAARKELPRVKESKDYTSSAWTLVKAADDLAEGIRAYNRRDFAKTLTLMTDALLNDSRVFKSRDLKDLESVLEKSQSLCKIWPYHSTPEFLQSEALRRIEEEGDGAWDVIRPALNIIIRMWIGNSFPSYKYQPHGELICAYIPWAVSMIEWGRTQWKDVKSEVRGEVFDLPFLNTVKKWHMHGLQLLIQRCRAEDAQQATLIMGQVDHFLAELRAQPVPSREENPVLAASSYYYAKAEALRVKTLYHWGQASATPVFGLQKGLSGQSLIDLWQSRAKANQRDDYTHFLACTETYIALAECYGEDDERYCTYLAKAVDMAERAPDTAYTFYQLPLYERVCDAFPKMKKIWEKSHYGGDERDGFVGKVVNSIDEIRRIHELDEVYGKLMNAITGWRVQSS